MAQKFQCEIYNTIPFHIIIKMGMENKQHGINFSYDLIINYVKVNRLVSEHLRT
jgi:hypothetical protein